MSEPTSISKIIYIVREGRMEEKNINSDGLILKCTLRL
jgi:hypothetical protein